MDIILNNENINIEAYMRRSISDLLRMIDTDERCIRGFKRSKTIVEQAERKGFEQWYKENDEAIERCELAIKIKRAVIIRKQLG